MTLKYLFYMIGCIDNINDPNSINQLQDCCMDGNFRLLFIHKFIWDISILVAVLCKVTITLTPKSTIQNSSLVLCFADEKIMVIIWLFTQRI